MRSDATRDGAALIGDIGGTFSRLRLVTDAGESPIAVLANDDFDDFETLLAAYLQQESTAVAQAVFCVAGPVADNRVQLTNRGWVIDGEMLCRSFGWRRVTLLNDFAAQALAVPDLQPREQLVLQAGSARQQACRAVLGPGTGLGVAGLVPMDEQWLALPGEGGHASYPPRSPQEQDLLNYLVQRGEEHVSAEDLLSGAGLVRLYAFCRDRAGKPVEPVQPPQITAGAFGGDPEAARALELFLGALGNVAGNVALTLGAVGGVWLTGGILPRLYQKGGADYLRNSPLLARFVDKGRYREYLKAVPVHLVLAEEPAMLGLRRALKQLAAGPR